MLAGNCSLDTSLSLGLLCLAVDNKVPSSELCPQVNAPKWKLLEYLTGCMPPTNGQPAAGQSDCSTEGND